MVDMRQPRGAPNAARRRSGGPVVGLVRPIRVGEPKPLTEAQQGLVAACQLGPGAIQVLGAAGTGKTTALVAAVVARVRSGTPISRLVVLTASRPAAQQLRARIVAELGTTQRGLQVTTVHGWCQQLLHRFADAENPAPRLLSAPEQEFRVRELLLGIDQRRWPTELWPAVGTRGFASQVRKILARARQLGFDPADLAIAGGQAGRPEWVAVADFFNEYLDVLDAEGVIDYAELVHRARLLLQDAPARGQLPSFAATIFCDEFAELDRGMINVLADAHRAGSQVVAFADPDTSVFGFRGADPRAVASFAELFDRPGEPSRTWRLTENLRSTAEVAQTLQQIAARLPSRGIDHIPLAGPAGAAGAVRVLLVPDTASQAGQIAEVLRQAHLVAGWDWSQMAVITRSGQNAVASLARRLAATGVPVQVAGDEVALADELAVRQLLVVLTAGAQLARGEPLEPAQASRLLRTALGGLDALGLRRLGRELRRRALQRDPEAVVGSSGQLLAAELVRPDLVLPDEPGSPGQAGRSPGPSIELAALVRLRDLLAGLVRLIDQRADLSTLLWQVWSGTDWPRRLQAEALRGAENAPRAHRDLDAVVALFDLAAREISWAGAKGIRSLVAEVEGQQIPADTTRENDPRRAGVSVLTVHRAKGEQWRLVVLAGLQEGQWPVLGQAGGLLRADELAADGLQLPTAPGEQIAAERRALLLAASRATDEIVAVAIDDPSGQIDPPSRFLAELGAPIEPVGRAQNASSLPGLVAQLRRIATDPSAGPQLRQAAAAELGWLVDQVDDQGRPLVHGADPADWWGLRDATAAESPIVPAGQAIRLSGSEVESLLACPRQWFLASRARGQRPGGVEAAFGTLVHALIAEAASTGAAAAGLVDQLEQAWPRLAYPARWVSQAELDSARAALRRFDAWAANPDHQRLLGVEVGFTLPVVLGEHTVELVGTLDRLEIDHRGRLRVVDFKTGRTPRGNPEVKVMDQIGVYQLAAQMGAFDHLSGGVREVADAEVVYLRAEVAGGMPTVRIQPSLDDQPFHDDAPMSAGSNWVQQRLAAAAKIIAAEDFYANVQQTCQRCVFRLGCPAQQIGGEL